MATVAELVHSTRAMHANRTIVPTGIQHASTRCAFLGNLVLSFYSPFGLSHRTCFAKAELCRVMAQKLVQALVHKAQPTNLSSLVD